MNKVSHLKELETLLTSLIERIETGDIHDMTGFERGFTLGQLTSYSDVLDAVKSEDKPGKDSN